MGHDIIRLIVKLEPFNRGMKNRNEDKPNYRLRYSHYFVLGSKKGIANSDEISKANGITKQYVLKIMKTMVKSGIVGHKFGVKGGFYFAKKPEEVTLYDIVTLMQGDLLLNQCIADSGSCSAGESVNRAVRDFYSRLQDDITEKMKSKTVKMLLEENKHYLTDDV